MSQFQHPQPFELMIECIQNGQAANATQCLVILRNRKGAFIVRPATHDGAPMPYVDMVGLLRSAQLSVETDMVSGWRNTACPAPATPKPTDKGDA